MLFIIATPIGNLEDITLRALRVLKEVDVILAEDTRVTHKLLSHYAISKPMVRYDEHVAGRVHAKVVTLLEEGKSIALVSDAGTPGISDPGARLVAYAREHMPDIPIIPIPGPSAVTTALSVAGITLNGFTFMGYPPHKKGRKTFFENVKEISVRPVILYESPHRLQRTLTELENILGSTARLVIAKELTKIYERIWRGTVSDAVTYFIKEKGKGEFVVIVE